MRGYGTAVFRADASVEIGSGHLIDLAIGAAGTSAWQRCCLGLPTLTLTIVLAENRRAGARALEDAGATLLVGETAPVHEDLAGKLQHVGKPGVLANLRSACAGIIDGEGAARALQDCEHARA